MNAATSTAVAQSLPVGQNDTTTTAFVHQRPSSSSNQHIRTAPHRSARPVNMGPVTSTSEAAPGSSTTDLTPEPSPSLLQTSNAASLTQDDTVLDARKSVSLMLMVYFGLLGGAVVRALDL